MTNKTRDKKNSTMMGKNGSGRKCIRTFFCLFLITIFATQLCACSIDSLKFWENKDQTESASAASGTLSDGNSDGFYGSLEGTYAGKSEDGADETADSSDGKINVVLTAGFKKNEIFRIETISCLKPELMVYIYNMRNRYIGVYGKEILNTKTGGVTFDESIRQNALAKITKIKTMNLMADKYGVKLDADDEKYAVKAAEEYYKSLTADEIEESGITKELLTTMYREYALADKVYTFIIKDINPEVSDDEARTITVRQILIMTYSVSTKGKRVEFDEAAKEKAKEKCEEISSELKAGGDFDALSRKYNQADEAVVSFGKGQVDQKFEDAAFNLGTDEVSDVVETEDGYRIIKCITPFDKDQTEANKVNIAKKKKQDAFSKEYDLFAKPLTRALNEKLWDKTVVDEKSKITTDSFFDVYSKYFIKN